MTNIIGPLSNWGGYMGPLPNTQDSADSPIYTLPENPYVNSTSNPSELYGRTNAFISRLLATRMNVESGITNSILTGVGDVNFLIFKEEQIGAAGGEASTFAQYLTYIPPENLKAEKDTTPLFLAAK